LDVPKAVERREAAARQHCFWRESANQVSSQFEHQIVLAIERKDKKNKKKNGTG
jgi:hypothetical protein